MSYPIRTCVLMAMGMLACSGATQAWAQPSGSTGTLYTPSYPPQSAVQPTRIPSDPVSPAGVAAANRQRGDSGSASNLAGRRISQKPDHAGDSTIAPAASTPLQTLKTTGLALALVIGLIFAAARIWKSHTSSTTSVGAAIESLGAHALPGRQMVQLVRVGTRVLVLGASSDGLRTLSEITDPAEVELLTGMCRSGRESNRVEMNSFVETVRRQFRKPSSSMSASHRGDRGPASGTQRSLVDTRAGGGL